jgi:hypothetical protein
LFNLKKLVLGTTAALAIGAIPASAPAQFDSSTTTTLIALLLASKLGVDPSLVTGLALANGYQNTGYYTVPPYTRTVYDVAPVFVIYRNAPRRYTPLQILQRRRMGWGWDRVALWAGMPRPTYQRYYAMRQFDPNYWGQTVTQRVLLVPTTDVTRMRTMGMNWRDMTLAAIMAREARQPVYTVATRWRQTPDWNRVSSYYHVQPTVIRNRVSDFRRTRQVPTTWRSTAVATRPATTVRTGNRAMPIRVGAHGKVVHKGNTTITHKKGATVSTRTVDRAHGSTHITTRTHKVTTPSGNVNTVRKVTRTYRPDSGRKTTHTTTTIHHQANTKADNKSTTTVKKHKGHGG